MRYLYILCFLFAGILLSNCATHQKIEYNIPVYVPDSNRAPLLAALERGRKLYEANCSGCHGIFTKGKDGIPNFTDQQIDNYTAWAIRMDHNNHAVAAHMSTDQLHEVFMFLRFRKTDSAPAKLKPGAQAQPDSLGK